MVVKRDTDKKWYITLQYDQEGIKSYSLLRKKEVGIDMGLKKFAHDSDNHVIENNRFLKRLKRS